MLRFLLPATIALAASTSFAQDRAQCVPCGTDIRDAGVYHVATGQLTPPGPQAHFAPGGVFYNNTCPTGKFSPLLSGSTLIDEGRIPSPSSPSPNVGIQQTYHITAFDVSYCTRELQTQSGGPGATIRVRFFQSYAPCTPLASAGTPTADITVTGLPASPVQGQVACYTVTIDLTGGSEFCFRGDGNGVFDGVAANDTFGYALTMPSQTGTTTSTVGGFVIAGDVTPPGACNQGDGTFYKNQFNVGTGLDNQNTFRLDGSGSQASGCLFFSNGDFGGFYMKMTAALGDCSCAPNDADHDGISDCSDGCPDDPLKATPGQCGCGIPDTDSDGDGVANCIDGCPNDPQKSAPGQCGCGAPDTDSDGDGTADCIDGCPNDPNKTAAGICGCGIADTDTDGDGTPNCNDGCPTDPNKIAPGACGCGFADTDTDGDGTPDCHDGCPTDPNKIAPGQCGCFNPDTDSDGDGIADCVDGCPSDPNKTSAGQCGCGIPDTDSDGDGVADCVDGCPFDKFKTSPGICGCGVLDIDTDGDGVADCHDNCPSIANPGQEDCNGNGIGDACKLASGSFDTDGDGVPDECEAGIGTPYCFGDGSGAPCPCGNNGHAGQGCETSRLLGSQLYNFGGASVSNEDTQLYVIDMPFNKFGLIFMGTTKTNGGLGTPFGDGLRCVGGLTHRFNVQSTGPTGTYSLIDPVSHAPALITPGTTWFFQAWFRDKPTSPCGHAINLSNALQINFVP